MNLQSLIVVVLRLLALDFLTRVAVQLTPQLLSPRWHVGLSPPIWRVRVFASMGTLRSNPRLHAFLEPASCDPIKRKFGQVSEAVKSALRFLNTLHN
jgi:hypothetical protein